MHDMITTLLELAGLLLLVASFMVAGWQVAPFVGLAVGGSSMLAVSLLLTWRHRQ